MNEQRSLSGYPFWLNYASLGGGELQVYLAIFNSVRPRYDGTLQRSGYCCEPQIAAMTGLSKRTVGNASRSLRKKGLLRAEASTNHADERLIWTVPYFEPTAEQLEDLTQTGWYDVITEAERYNALIDEKIKPFTIPCPAERLAKEGFIVAASWAALKQWGQIQNSVAKIITSEKCEMSLEEVLYRGLLVQCLVEGAARKPVTFCIEMCKAIVLHSMGKKLTPTAYPHREIVTDVAKTTVDVTLVCDGSREAAPVLRDVLKYTLTPEPLPECVRIPRMPVVETSVEDIPDGDVPGEELVWGEEDFSSMDFEDLFEVA